MRHLSLAWLSLALLAATAAQAGHVVPSVSSTDDDRKFLREPDLPAYHYFVKREQVADQVELRICALEDPRICAARVVGSGRYSAAEIDAASAAMLQAKPGRLAVMYGDAYALGRGGCKNGGQVGGLIGGIVGAGAGIGTAWESGGLFWFLIPPLTAAGAAGGGAAGCVVAGGVGILLGTVGGTLDFRESHTTELRQTLAPLAKGIGHNELKPGDVFRGNLEETVTTLERYLPKRK